MDTEGEKSKTTPPPEAPPAPLPAAPPNPPESRSKARKWRNHQSADSELGILICISLASHLHFIGILLAFHWHFISISLAFHLHLTHRMNPHVCLAQFRNCRNPPFQYLFVRLICLIFVRTGNAAMRLPAASNGKRRRLGFCPSIVFQWRRGTRSSLHASFPHPRRYFIGID